MTLQETAKLLTLMGIIYPKVTEGTEKQITERVNVWHLLLGDIDYHLAQRAFIKIVRTNKYEPKPADIVEAVRLMIDTTPAAEQAWEEVTQKLDPYKKPDWSNKAIKEAVNMMNYRALCESESPSIDRAQFIKIYNNNRTRNQSDQENKVVIALVDGKPRLLGL